MKSEREEREERERKEREREEVERGGIEQFHSPYILNSIREREERERREKQIEERVRQIPLGIYQLIIISYERERDR
jgi:hypothetical protein